MSASKSFLSSVRNLGYVQFINFFCKAFGVGDIEFVFQYYEFLDFMVCAFG